MTTTDNKTYRCQQITNGVRCLQPATHRFLVNGEQAIYLGYTCLEHGEAVLAEYATIQEIVGVWTLEELPS